MLSIVFGFITVIQYFIDSEFPRGWTSVIVSVSFLGGIQLIFLGVIGEYIGGIFDEVKKRPAYLIDEVYLGVK
jgi:dolichol-phosphate mannosyltransferase